ncbi:DUF3658 domain-containing protein [Chitinimonas sp. BJB300]|uniref:DUF3658 domain-containing protein n=1 Tax=Chitinimonas sp. BJB300 TaxID=1559339 RepID=UPI000C12049A|nr:DUF3658 domain-containing protein [Chitinimonas sp. BJB300]PHV13252.1 hypothetical protein CSQ89_01685 [Chitinimonas sp. BJB300]TSJ89644.1 DUF1835 domain-containing protein [Chitinimonas sp. BJB300]
MDLHLVTSPSAAGGLQQAIKRRLITGTVFCVGDSFDLGPLDDGHERMRFWHALQQECYGEEIGQVWYPAFGEMGSDPDDSFAVWRALRQRLEQDKPTRLLIWASGSGSDYVFLRMACHWLGGCQVPLVHVPVPPRDGYHAVAVHEASGLAAFLPHAAALSRMVVDDWAQEFQSIAARPVQLRECNDEGELVFRDTSVHDQLLLDACAREWRVAVRVVGDAMGHCDPRNGLSDVFLSSRLQHLIATGQVEADSSPTPLRHFRVRLAPAS